ncbi:MAG: RNA pseudouridine synthase, partial [Gammaproteobacteria bacterium]|nr:RNA pseudouridine synthase [Gammaproteobacteria bacterium]
MTEKMTNRGFCYRETIGAHDDGTPLVRYLARRYPHSSLDDWRRRIDAGRVRIDDRPGDAHTLVRRGQRLSWDRPPWREPDA